MASAISDPLVVEFDAENRNPYFPPLDRAMRGRYDAQLAARHDKDAGALLSEIPEAIPGQRLAVTESGEAEIVEPLHDPRYAAIAERIKSRGIRLRPERERLAIDKATALYWIREAVAAGQARVVSGRLPERIEGTPKLHFITQPHESSEGRLSKALESMAAAQREQTAALLQLVTALANKK
jgi:hypothetical protein